MSCTCFHLAEGKAIVKSIKGPLEEMIPEFATLISQLHEELLEPHYNMTTPSPPIIPTPPIQITPSPPIHVGHGGLQRFWQRFWQRNKGDLKNFSLKSRIRQGLKNMISNRNAQFK